MPRKLYDLNVQEISCVDKPHARRKLLVIKRIEEAVQDKNLTWEQLVKLEPADGVFVKGR